MDCRTARKLIPALMDGELPDARSQQLSDHLAACTDCARAMAALKATMKTLGTWQGIESRRTYADFRVRAEQAKSRRAGRWQFPAWSLSPRLASAGLVTLALLGGGISGAYHSSRSVVHTHVLTADAAQASDALSLDVFDDGLSDALAKADSQSGEVTRK